MEGEEFPPSNNQDPENLEGRVGSKE